MYFGIRGLHIHQPGHHWFHAICTVHTNLMRARLIISNRNTTASILPLHQHSLLMEAVPFKMPVPPPPPPRFPPPLYLWAAVIMMEATCPQTTLLSCQVCACVGVWHTLWVCMCVCVCVRVYVCVWVCKGIRGCECATAKGGCDLVVKSCCC